MLAVPVWRPEFNPHIPDKKQQQNKQVRWCVLVISALGVRQKLPWGLLPSHPNLMASSRPVRDTISKNKVVSL